MKCVFTDLEGSIATAGIWSMQNNSGERENTYSWAGADVAALVVFGLVAASWPAAAQTVPLGAADTFAILALQR